MPGYLDALRISETARKHGVTDQDMLHALRNRVRQAIGGDDLLLVIGPAQDATLLEIGVLGPDSDDPVVIHAMPLRPKFR